MAMWNVSINHFHPILNKEVTMLVLGDNSIAKWDILESSHDVRD